MHACIHVTHTHTHTHTHMCYRYTCTHIHVCMLSVYISICLSGQYGRVGGVQDHKANRVKEPYRCGCDSCSGHNITDCATARSESTFSLAVWHRMVQQQYCIRGEGILIINKAQESIQYDMAMQCRQNREGIHVITAWHRLATEKDPCHPARRHRGSISIRISTSI